MCNMYFLIYFLLLYIIIQKYIFILVFIIYNNKIYVKEKKYYENFYSFDAISN